MKKGIVKANLIYLNKGGYVRKGQPITNEDVTNFDALVKEGKIIADKKSIEAFNKKQQEIQEARIKEDKERQAKIAKAKDAEAKVADLEKEVADLKKDKEDAEAKVADLEKEVADLKKQIQQPKQK